MEAIIFNKKIIEDETLCDIKHAEKSKISTIENNTIEDADFVELT